MATSKKFPKFSAKKPPSKEELKQFRAAVAQLKKQGLIPGKTDPRVARPAFTRGGKTLAEIVNQNASKLHTPSRVVKSSSPKSSAAKSSATKTVPVKSVLPKPPPSPKLKPLNRPLSIRDYPLKGKTLASALNGLEENFAEINAMKKEGEKFAFQIDVPDSNGKIVPIHSYAIFHDIRDLADYLRDSDGIQQILRKHGDSRKLYNALKLVRWNKSAREWKPGPQKLLRKKSHAGKQAKKRLRK